MNARDFDIARLQALDDEEWGHLREAYHDRIFGYAFRRLGDRDKAEDVACEVFLGAVKGIGRFNTRYNVEQYLMGIARNKVIDVLRRTTGEVQAPERDEESSGFFATMPDRTRTPADVTLVIEKVERQRDAFIEAIREMVEDLKARDDYQRLMTIEMCLLTDLSHREIAARAGIENEKSVAGVKFRAIREIQTRLRSRDPRRTLFSGLWERI